MEHYGNLLKQLEELDRRIEEAKRNEYGPTLDEVRATIAAFGFSAAEVFGPSRGHAGKTRPKRSTGKRSRKASSEAEESRQARIDFT
jgi:DNA-binding protein H-NS